MLKRSPSFVAFLQATAITVYCGLVGLLMWQGESLSGKVNNFLGPVLFLVLFVVSAVICSLIYFGFAFVTFWDKKDLRSSIKVVFYTTTWLVFYVFLVIFGIYFT